MEPPGEMRAALVTGVSSLGFHSNDECKRQRRGRWGDAETRCGLSGLVLRHCQPLPKSQDTLLSIDLPPDHTRPGRESHTRDAPSPHDFPAPFPLVISPLQGATVSAQNRWASCYAAVSIPAMPLPPSRRREGSKSRWKDEKGGRARGARGGRGEANHLPQLCEHMCGRGEACRWQGPA